MVRQLFGMAIGQIEEELQIGRHGPIMTARDGDRRRLAGRNSTTALANGKVWWLMKTTIYGIRNCDMMKKARAWLDARRVAYAFHDYKAAGIGRDKLEDWVAQVGWETLLNRAGTTFRKLSDRDRATATSGRAINATILLFMSLTSEGTTTICNFRWRVKTDRQAFEISCL